MNRLNNNHNSEIKVRLCISANYVKYIFELMLVTVFIFNSQFHCNKKRRWQLHLLPFNRLLGQSNGNPLQKVLIV